MPTGANAATPIRPRITGIKPLTKEVYGYLPYWRLDSGTADRLVYDYISTIAFFGLGIMADGNIDTSWVGYREYVGDDAAAVTNAAHDKGVRVVPTFQLFDRRRAPQDDRVPRQRRRPDQVHRAGARPDGRAQGGRREPRLRADAGAR